MNKSVNTVLLPLLVVNYVLGLKIIEFPKGQQKPWFGIFYTLLLWSIFQFLLIRNMILRPLHYYVYFIVIIALLNVLLSIVAAVYYDKKFRNCLKKLAIVDATLKELGIITNYQQLRRKILWIILGWFMTVIFINSVHTIFLKKNFKYDTITSIYNTLILNHCSHVTFIGDLTMTSIIGYVGVTFNQINDHLRNMANNNKYRMTQAWDNTVHISQQRYANTSNDKWIIWIIIQLHLELRKICREIDSLYGVEMTFKMGYYIIFVALDLNNILHVIFIHNYTNSTLIYTISFVSWCSHDFLKLIVIIIVCERVSEQANSTKNFLNKASYSLKDVETCESISQLLLHIKQSPLRFCGIGLFQFDCKFIYGFVSSIGTVLVILIQAHIESDNLFQKL